MRLAQIYSMILNFRTLGVSDFERDGRVQITIKSYHNVTKKETGKQIENLGSYGKA